MTSMLLGLSLAMKLSPDASISTAAMAAGAKAQLEWRPGSCVPVSINGARLNLAISTADPVAVYLNPEAAQRAGLVARGLQRLFGLRYRVGPALYFDGRSRRVSIAALDHPPELADVIWFEDSRISQSCEGYVSIWLLAAPQITLVQSGAQPMTRERVIATSPLRQRIPTWKGSIELGGRSYFFGVNLDDADAQMNATAAAELSDAGQLALTGAFRMHPIQFGVERPVELAHPINWSPFGLAVADIYVRREALGTPTLVRPASEDAHDPDEVASVVVNGRRPSEARYAWITIGYKALARCRSITFDRTTHTITLNCAD